MSQKLIRWKILQCDAPQYLGLAKAQVHRMWQGGTLGFDKKLIVDGVTIEIKSVQAPGCILAYISIIGGSLNIFNRLYRQGSWAQPFNFKLENPTTDDAKNAVPWWKVVTPVGIQPLAFDTTFTVRKDGLASTTGNLGTVGLSSFTQTKIIEQLGDYVKLRSVAARNMFDLILQRFRFFWTEGDATAGFSSALNTTVMRVSDARDDGSFYLMYGMWDVQREPDLTPTPWTPSAPRLESFVGFVILSTDLLDLIKKNPESKATGISFIDVSSKARLIGKLLTFDIHSGVSLFAEGEEYTREEAGFFPFSGYAGSPAGTEYTHVYRPDENSLVLRSWPFAMPQFARRGLQVDTFTQSWDYDFKVHKLGTDGSILVEDVPLPAFGDSSMTITSVLHGENMAVGGYTMAVVFFDGENFIPVGSHVQTGTSTVVDPFGINSVINPGSYTIKSPFPQTQSSTNGFDSFSAFLPDIGAAYSTSSDGNGNPNVVFEENFTTTPYSFTAERDASFSWGVKPLLPSWGVGPSWGTYSMGGNPAVFTEHGFTCGGGDYGIFNPIFFAPPNGLGNLPIMNMMTEYLDVNGVFWYRRNGDHGYFIYEVTAADITAWRNDCEKYQNIVREQEGYRLIKNKDGSTTAEPNYEDPEIVLTRVMHDVKIGLNNFGTPELVVWTEGLGLWVIVER